MDLHGASLEPGDLDAEVRVLLAGGQRERAAALSLERLLPPMRAWLRSVLAEPDARLALELFQEALWRGLPRFRFESSLRAWAFGLALQAAHRIHRRARRGESPFDPEPAGGQRRSRQSGRSR